MTSKCPYCNYKFPTLKEKMETTKMICNNETDLKSFVEYEYVHFMKRMDDRTYCPCCFEDLGA